MSKQQMLISNLISETGALGDARMVGMDSGGGGSVTVDTELSFESRNPVENRVIALAMDQASYLYEEIPAKISVTGQSAIITPEDNTIYDCGELTSLTIINPPATGAYSIVFTSGSTATTTTIPSTILGLESFVAEANTLYEINVLDNRAVVGSWAVSV